MKAIPTACLCGAAMTCAAAAQVPATIEGPGLSTDWGLTLQLKSLEGSGLGLDYAWVPFPDARNGKDLIENYGALGNADWGLLADIKAEGFLAFQSGGDETSPKALSVEGNLFSNFRVGEVAGQDWWVDVGVSAFQFEADQDFDRVNYVFRPYVLVPVPGSHLLSGAIQELFDVGTSQATAEGGVDLPNNRPVYLRAGYSLVSGIKDDGSDAENRAELAATWKVHLYRGITFDAGYRHFFGEDDDYGFLELTLSMPVVEDVAVILKYTDGELPPSQASAQSISGGFSISF